MTPPTLLDRDRPGPESGAHAGDVRLPALDVLRAVAVIAVLGSHFLFLGNLDRLAEVLPAPVLGSLRVWERAGWMGVDLFFVLSGFLVSGLLFREHARYGAVDGKRFFLRRGLKIYPAFYLFFAIGAPLIAKVADPVRPVVYWVRFVGELVFMQNYYASMWPHTWTLAVEEHFYLLLLALVLVLVRRARQRGAADPFQAIPRLFAWVAIGALASRIYLAREVLRTGDADLENRILVWTHTRIDSLFFGVVIAYFWHRYPQRTRAWVKRARPGLLVLAVLGVIPSLAVPRTDHLVISTVGFTLQYLAFGAWLVLTLLWGEGEHRLGIWRAVSRLAAIGRHSYSIYLWHMMVATFGVHFFRVLTGRADRLGIEIVFYLVTSVVLGIVMSVVVEQPVLKLRERWFPSRSGSVTAAARGSASASSPG